MRANAKVSVATNAVHGPDICPNAANASEVWSAGVWDGEPDVDVTETELELDAEDVRLAEELAEDDDDDCEPLGAEMGSVGNDSDTDELATLQNSCETFSAAARSPGHVELMHPTNAAENVDPLKRKGHVSCLILGFEQCISRTADRSSSHR